MLMGLTAEAAVRIGQIQTDGLQFSVTHVAYGSSGFIPTSPATPFALDPNNTSLIAEIFRKPVPPGNTVINEIFFPRGKETTYTTVGGTEFTGVVGEAGLIATVTAPGSSGLTVGYQFLLAQCHFGRVVFCATDRLSITFRIAYYTSPIDLITYDEDGFSYEDDIDYSGF